jgi:hypothetical protein
MQAYTSYSTNLPILSKAADAYKAWHGFLPSLPRHSRYTIGTKIDGLFVDTVELILTASYAGREEKLPIIIQAGNKLDSLKLFLQIAWELKALDNKKYLTVSNPLSEVGKMLGGWRKQLQKETPVR